MHLFIRRHSDGGPDMTHVLTDEDLRRWLARFATTVLERRDHLDELDAATGDGEHGANLERGMSAVLSLLEGQVFDDIEGLLGATGMTIVNTVGGASGALYGTLFLRLSDVGKNRQELDLDALTEGFVSALAGIMELGSTKPGDKTLVDALHPAVEALSAAREDGLWVALDRASHAAAEGRDATAAMVARRGRGTYMGDRSLGHVDAGATSMAALFEMLRMPPARDTVSGPDAPAPSA